LGDIDLIGRARGGDWAAWETLVSAHQEAIFRLAYLLLGDAQEAEDVAQETFVRAFRALERFDTDRSSSIRPWLLSIAANLSHNRRRSIKRYLAALGRFVQSRPEQISLIGERTSQQWEAETLWQAVKRLRPHEQEVVYMRYFLDLSEAEMASALGIATGTVKSRLHRALHRLRSVVDQDFPGLREERLT
jgi:RNA polymerase sigma-70 factor (ECF subfamily)